MSIETVNPFLTWAPPGQPIVIQIDHSAMDRMNVEVMRGFGVTRRRGTETGGVLLGTIDRRSTKPLIYIRDFEVVPCEYASGPSYVLSTGDRDRFKNVISKWQPSLDRDIYAVGYFRSHTRDGFALDERDAGMVREFFPDPLDVALLIKPFATRSATAGFFLKEKGGLVTASTPFEFKFETPGAGTSPVVERVPGEPDSKLGGNSVPSRPPSTAPQPVRVDSSSHREPMPPPPSVGSGARSRALTAAFCLALLAFGVACGYEYARSDLRNRRAATNLAGPGGLPNSDLYSMQLQAARAGNSILIRWSREAGPVQAALHGVLTIAEGQDSKDVKLGFAELRSGTAMYPIRGSEVRLRLEVFFRDNRSFVESAVYSDAVQ